MVGLAIGGTLLMATNVGSLPEGLIGVVMLLVAIGWALTEDVSERL